MSLLLALAGGGGGDPDPVGPSEGGGAARPRMRYERRPLNVSGLLTNDDLAALLFSVLELA